MKHVFRFLGAKKPEGWNLEPEEAQHAKRVLRLTPGDMIEVTDGMGRWAKGTLASLTDKSGTVTVEAEFEEKPHSPKICLAVGALKPGFVDEILPSLVELGVDEVHVFHQDETAKNRLTEKAFERWRRVIASAAKQSKRAWVPRIEAHGSLEELYQKVHPAGQRPVVLLPEAELSMLETPLATDSVWAIVGGEKGFSDEELAFLKKNNPLFAKLGPHILRATTATIATVAVLALRRGS